MQLSAGYHSRLGTTYVGFYISKERKAEDWQSLLGGPIHKDICFSPMEKI